MASVVFALKSVWFLLGLWNPVIVIIGGGGGISGISSESNWNRSINQNIFYDWHSILQIMQILSISNCEKQDVTLAKL